MTQKTFTIPGLSPGETISLDDPRLRITPQPEPTAPRIKALLSKGLLAPDTLTPSEVQEMTASVVYHLIMRKAKKD